MRIRDLPGCLAVGGVLLAALLLALLLAVAEALGRG